jgi:FkbM family methyltransferase
VQWAPKLVRHPELLPIALEDRYLSLATAALVQPGWRCVDGGCHLGSKLAEFCKLSPDVEHLAFEPVPHKAAWLRKRFGGRAEIHEAALGAVAGTAELSEPVKGSGYSSLRRIDGDVRATFEVEVTTLDDAVAGRQVDFVKLDLEGFELFALQGAKKTIEDCRPVIQFECSLDSDLASVGYSRTDLWDLVADELGYDVYVASDFCFGRDPVLRDEFRRQGTFPFPGFNYFAVPTGTPVSRLL